MKTHSNTRTGERFFAQTNIILLTLLIWVQAALAQPPATPEPMSGKTALKFFTDNQIQAGWNLGSTLDAAKTWETPIVADETAWGNPLATQALFNGVKESGFDIVRIPVLWFQYIGPAPDYKVNEARLGRVAEVIGYAKTAGFKAVIINIHHDGNYTDQSAGTWGFVDFASAVENPAKKAAVQDQISKVWTQIANYFKNYGDYLIFETLNEVHCGNWGHVGLGCNYAGNASSYQNQQDILFDWNQAALSAIRATGGNNATRFVAVPGLGATEPEIVVAAHEREKLLPDDGYNGTDKLIVSVHYYDPPRYTVAGITDPQPLVHTWGTQSEWHHLAEAAASLKSHFIDNGIPVYFGEWGAPGNLRSSMSADIKNTHLNYIRSVAAAARANGIVPVYWDDGGDFKVLERSNGRPMGFGADVLSAITGAPKAVNWLWGSFTDDFNGGISTITFNENAGVVTASGNVIDDTGGGYEYGFVGWTATPADAATEGDLETAESISFKVNGDGNAYRVQLRTSDITNYDYYSKTFPTTAGVEKTVTLNISQFAQAGWGAPKPLTQSLIESINWQTGEGFTGAFSITMKDFVLNPKKTVPTIETEGTWEWETFDDASDDGISTITFNENAGVVTVSGEVIGDAGGGLEFAYVGWKAIPDNSVTLNFLKAATEISFKVTGDGKQYKLKLPMSNIDDGDHYTMTFPTTNGVETTVTLDISQFAQEGWGKQKPFDQSLIESIQWQTTDFTGTFNITITDLVLKTPITVPTIGELDYDLAAVDYTGIAQPVAVTVKTGVTGLGVIAVLYNGSATAPVKAGTYAVTALIGEGTVVSWVIPLGNYVINNTTPSSSSNDTPSSSSGDDTPSSSSKGETPIRLPQIASAPISVHATGNSIILQNPPQNTKVAIYNLQGKRVYMGNPENPKIMKIMVQTKGMYIVKAGTQTFRIVVK
jgi:endoglucanase